MTVLVVEDDFLIADDYRSTIEAYGWQVLGPAPTEKSGLALLREARPDVALLDLMLRRGTSAAVAEALVLMGIPFILASACENPVDIGGDVFQGVVNIGKPRMPEELIAALKKAVAP
jgi:DNA-binding response OmpR family regulator